MARRRRQNAEYKALGPGGGGFNAAAFDEVSLVLFFQSLRSPCDGVLRICRRASGEKVSS